MIRRAKPGEERILTEIWFEASVCAHDFIDKRFWEANKSAMQNKYIPHVETWVCEQSGEPVGFYCLKENVLAALFVHPDKQGTGIGSKLLRHAMAQRSSLTLFVYTQNNRAIRFYTTHGFTHVETRLCEHTSCEELVLRIDSRE